MLRVNIADIVILHPALKQSFELICGVGFDMFGYDGPNSTPHTLSIFLSPTYLKLSEQIQGKQEYRKKLCHWLETACLNPKNNNNNMSKISHHTHLIYYDQITLTAYNWLLECCHKVKTLITMWITCVQMLMFHLFDQVPETHETLVSISCAPFS